MKHDPRFELTEERLSTLRCMHNEGSSFDEMIWFLFKAGVPKPGVILALRITGVMGLAEAKETTHNHPAFEFRRADDEAFRESLFTALEESRELGYAEPAHLAV